LPGIYAKETLVIKKLRSKEFYHEDYAVHQGKNQKQISRGIRKDRRGIDQENLSTDYTDLKQNHNRVKCLVPSRFVESWFSLKLLKSFMVKNVFNLNLRTNCGIKYKITQ
jgi:hypothetical protein